MPTETTEARTATAVAMLNAARRARDPLVLAQILSGALERAVRQRQVWNERAR